MIGSTNSKKWLAGPVTVWAVLVIIQLLPQIRSYSTVGFSSNFPFLSSGWRRYIFPLDPLRAGEVDSVQTKGYGQDGEVGDSREKQLVVITSRLNNLQKGNV